MFQGGLAPFFRIVAGDVAFDESQLLGRIRSFPPGGVKKAVPLTPAVSGTRRLRGPNHHVAIPEILQHFCRRAMTFTRMTLIIRADRDSYISFVGDHADVDSVRIGITVAKSQDEALLLGSSTLLPPVAVIRSDLSAEKKEGQQKRNEEAEQTLELLAESSGQHLPDGSETCASAQLLDQLQLLRLHSGDADALYAAVGRFQHFEA